MEAVMDILVSYAPVIIGLPLAVAVIYDCIYMRLPNILTLGTAPVAIALSAYDGDLFFSLCGALLGYASIITFRSTYRDKANKPGIGAGDAKLMIPLGASVGPFAVPFVLILGSFFAMCGAILMLLFYQFFYQWEDKKIPQKIPLGPFLFMGWIGVTCIKTYHEAAL